LQEENEVTHTRKVNTIWDALADAGGFYEVISLISFLFICNYQNFFYVRELSKVLYFTEAGKKPAKKSETNMKF